MIEAMNDPKTWLFALFVALGSVPNSFANQQTLIIASFGFTTVQTTLLSCIPGVIGIFTISTGAQLAARLPNSRAYVGAAYFVPVWVGILLVYLLPWSDQVGLLAGIYLSTINSISMVLALSWVTSVTAGHTKRVVTNAVILSGYCIGNAAGPFMWKAQYKPRYHVPWAVIGGCCVICPILLLAIRAVLVKENRIREAEPIDDNKEYLIERITEDGKRVKVKVDKEFLDMTDRQNRDFRYVL
ncbi:MFS general substrate transporter, partial [Rhizopogon vinicolor AM-OR11-026]